MLTSVNIKKCADGSVYIDVRHYIIKVLIQFGKTATQWQHPTCTSKTSAWW